MFLHAVAELLEARAHLCSDFLRAMGAGQAGPGNGVQHAGGVECFTGRLRRELRADLLGMELHGSFRLRDSGPEPGPDHLQVRPASCITRATACNSFFPNGRNGGRGAPPT